ncbi:MAG: hypothetical protein ABI136_05465 [Ginsengibacter sp.]
MKKIFVSVLLLFVAIISQACPTCEAAQPKILRGITHGTGPTSNWDYVAGIVTLLIVIFVLFFTIKWLVDPGEKEENHIKRSVLNF